MAGDGPQPFSVGMRKVEGFGVFLSLFRPESSVAFILDAAGTPRSKREFEFILCKSFSGMISYLRMAADWPELNNCSLAHCFDGQLTL